MKTTDDSKTRIIPLVKWNDFHPWPSIPNFRYYIKNQDKNGINEFSVVKRVGKRILIDEAAFFKWVNAQPGQSNE